MSDLDEQLKEAELDASHPRHEGFHGGPVNRPISSYSAHSASTNLSSSSSSVADADINRVPTSYDLERHPTALSRIATYRSQHTATVGAGVKSRPSRRPLPPFGAGKPYPPLLPEREEYVVEFDGADDKLHPLNWPVWKK